MSAFLVLRSPIPGNHVPRSRSVRSNPRLGREMVINLRTKQVAGFSHPLSMDSPIAPFVGFLGDFWVGFLQPRAVLAGRGNYVSVDVVLTWSCKQAEDG